MLEAIIIIIISAILIWVILRKCGFIDIKYYNRLDGNTKDVLKTLIKGGLVLFNLVLEIVGACFLGWYFVNLTGLLNSDYSALCGLLVFPLIIFFSLLFWGISCKLYKMFAQNIYISSKLPVYLRYENYIKENITKINLFIRQKSLSADSDMSFANKICKVDFKQKISDMSVYNKIFEIKLLDKISGEEIIYEIYSISEQLFVRMDYILKSIINVFDYDTKAEDIVNIIENNNNNYVNIKHNLRKATKKHKDVYLDINEASEAELTAIPGVTIAKAKHAAKVRKEQKMFLSLNQFYKAIELDEEFIEQVKSKGNKILINDLPDYKRIEMNNE